MKYELCRGTKDKHVHVLCYYDRFYTEDVPLDVRKRGPWQMLDTGPVDELKLRFRRDLAKHKYVLIEANPVGFRVTNE